MHVLEKKCVKVIQLKSGKVKPKAFVMTDD
jgi:hypothetical protein